MNRRTIIVVVLLSLLGGAALVYGTIWTETHASGRARTAHFLSDASKVVIVDARNTRDSSSFRVRVHDTRTGAELVRTRLRTGWKSAQRAMRNKCYDCIPASRDRLWCCEMSGDDGLNLRSLDSLEVVADEERLHALAPGLSQGLLRARPGDLAPMVDLDDGALLVTGKDGRFYRVGVDLSARVEQPRTFDQSDPAAFEKWSTDTFHMDNLRLPAHSIPFEHGSGLVHSAHLTGRRLRLEQPDVSSKRSFISVLAPNDSYGVPGPHAAVAPHPDQTFLDAGFLADPDWGELKPVILENPPSLVLAHFELAKAGRQLILSRVGREGELGWSCALDDDEVRGARLAEGLLVVVLRHAMVGIDPATGAVRYRQRF